MLIGKLATTVGVTKESIRHYTDIGLLKPTSKQAGTRYYNDFSEDDLERLKWISLGKSLGFTLSEIKPYLNLFMDDDLPKETMTALFREKLIEVEAQIETLQNIRTILVSKVRDNPFNGH